MSTRALVYAYSCAAPLAGWEHVEAEHERRTMLWDELVRIERTIEGQLLERAALDDPAIMRASETIAQLTARLAEAPDDKDARAQRRAAYEERRALLKTWNRAHKEVLREYEERRQRAVTLARQQTECFWGNYLHVLQMYETGRQVCRQFGRRLREHDERREDGVIAVQIQRTRSGLGAAPGELCDGTVSYIQIGGAGYDRVLEMRVDAEGNTVRIPVRWHRELPEDARVKWAQLKWHRRGLSMRYQLCLTLNVPAVPLRVEGDAAPARVEFLHERCGGLKVLAVTPPGGGAPSLWALPPRWLARAERAQRRFAELREGWLEEGRAAWGDHPRFGEMVRCPREIEMMEQLQASWAALPAGLRAWLGPLRRRWRECSSMMERVAGHRRDLYRLFAREVVHRWPVIELPELDLAGAATAQRGEPQNRDRHLAALHILRAEILHQAQKVGCLIVASGSSSTPAASRPSSAWARRKNLARERSRSRAEPVEANGV